MTGLLIFFAAIGGLAVLGLLLLATWLVVAGDREQDIAERDERDAEAWAAVAQDPLFRAEMEMGLADAAAGRTRPWADVRREMDDPQTLNVQNHIGD